MTAPLVRPLNDADLPAAARLLAERHRRHRLAVPALDPAFEEPASALAEIQALLARPGASAAVAIRGGEPCGFMVGAPRADPSWGPTVWVEAAGHAAEHAEDVRDLYAFLAAGWADAGRTAQSALVPATDDVALDAWFRIGFGHQHAHAVMPAPALEAIPPDPPGIAVRPAEERDIELLARLDILLHDHQLASPVFSGHPAPTLEEAVAEYQGEWGDPRFVILAAEVGGSVVGSVVGCEVEESGGNSGLIRPPGAAFLAFAAVLPAAQGRGVGRALANGILRWAATNGCETVAIDWRVTNLHASRTWTAHGFRPTFFRLHRRL